MFYSKRIISGARLRKIKLLITTLFASGNQNYMGAAVIQYLMGVFCYHQQMDKNFSTRME